MYQVSEGIFIDKISKISVAPVRSTASLQPNYNVRINEKYTYFSRTYPHDKRDEAFAKAKELASDIDNMWVGVDRCIK